MSKTVFKTQVGEYPITRDKVLEAMARFDQDYRPSVSKDSGQGWFVEQDGRRYPPKWVMSLATGVPRGKFFGGPQTNKPLTLLGFQVKPVDEDFEDQQKQVPLNDEMVFEVEAHLQAALRSNIVQLEPGLKITDGGKERIVPSGRIDITAEDKTGAQVVIELKAGEADRKAVAQVLGYMGDLTDDQNPPVRGILVAGEFSQRATAAVKVVTNLTLIKYVFKFGFETIDPKYAASMKE